MENEKSNVQTDLPLELHKAFKHKLTDERRHAKDVLRELVELWVKGNITLPDRPSRSIKPKRK
jgi:hypothetical protein